MVGQRHIQVTDRVHRRIKRFGHLGETFDEAIDRALDEAGAPDVED